MTTSTFVVGAIVPLYDEQQVVIVVVTVVVVAVAVAISVVVAVIVAARGGGGSTSKSGNMIVSSSTPYRQQTKLCSCMIYREVAIPESQQHKTLSSHGCFSRMGSFV